eukprot:14660212-Alexandrium_andersonii.AAC.1
MKRTTANSCSLSLSLLGIPACGARLPTSHVDRTAPCADSVLGRHPNIVLCGSWVQAQRATARNWS